jgi:cytoskeletal protein CcmA (bactofilin family)
MSVEQQRRLITLSCPECSHKQTEPSLVISTNCRACGQHFSVEDEKPVERKRYVARVASLKKPALEYPAVAPATIPLLKRKTIEGGFLRRFFVTQGARRPLDCYHCGHEFEVVAEAQSTQCSKCGGYVSLRDHEISDRCQQRIQTRGQVRILKGGSLSGEGLDCQDLIVLGSLSAPVVCSGKMTIKSHGKIPSDIRCKELRVERGVKVELQGEVHAGSVFIDGQVRANINCEGTIVLEKKALLQGVARAAGIVVKAGAKHSGVMEMIKPGTEA